MERRDLSGSKRRSRRRRAAGTTKRTKRTSGPTGRTGTQGRQVSAGTMTGSHGRTGGAAMAKVVGPGRGCAKRHPVSRRNFRQKMAVS